MIGTDSHTVNAGGLGMIAIGVGPFMKYRIHSIILPHPSILFNNILNG